ncbi:MAG TPA: TonB-dependent receptor [Longimicrobiales bacterium]
MFRGLLVAAVLALMAWADAGAQTSTGTLRGRVLDEAGAPVAGAAVHARNVATGAERTTLSAENGAYVLVGLAPGVYELGVEALGRASTTRTVRVLIGQTLIMDLHAAAEAIELEGITVVGNRPIEMRTSEIATNVTAEQIRSLPQRDRNFLNMAALAPGLTVSRDEMNRQISAGGLAASKVNLFVDGASYKNDILEGGLHGQDASRGNPFPQLAVQEFRVLTQNFKAEYQRAASAIVTATTKSGTNDFQLNGFVYGQNKGLVEPDPGAVILCNEAKERGDPCAPEPEYERLQFGLSAGGPIIRDRMHYFLAYEANVQDRQAQVTVGRPEFRDQFAQYEGTFDQPFRSHLGVAKLSYQPAENHTLNLSWHGRFESDKRGFGGQTSYESAEDVRIGYNVLTLQHSMSAGPWFNQAQISAQRSTWNPTVVNEDQDIGLEYRGVIRIGARDTEQRFVQDRLSFRDDLTRSGVRWAGDHTFKAGFNVDFLHYDVEKRFSGNPVFVFDPAVSMTVPIEARWGRGDPGMDEGNVQFGVYVQDDWDVTPRLQLNLGVRWDAETNQFNNKWVTPDSIRARLAGFVPDNYFTRGTEDRPMYLGAFQPRVGFSYDVFGTGRTVVHGGFGVYYDREVWNHLIDERFRLQWLHRTFQFTTDPAAEPTKIPWRDEYLSREGLESLVSGVNPAGIAEVFLLDNDTKPSKSHQWSFGVRQAVGDIVVGATYRGVRGYNLFSWYCATPHSEHGYCGGGGAEVGLPYSVLLSTDEGRSWYDAFDLTIEKPYTPDSRWGFTFAYTLADAERKGFDFFTLDFPDVAPEDWPVIDQAVEKHRIVASAIVGLPYDVQLSTLIQLGSGVPYDRRDETNGWGPRRVMVDWASQDSPNFRQVDFRLRKEVMLPTGARVGIVADAINVFNHDNFRGYEPLAVFSDGTPNPNFGKPQTWTADPGRRLQIGLDFSF